MNIGQRINQDSTHKMSFILGDDISFQARRTIERVVFLSAMCGFVAVWGIGLYYMRLGPRFRLELRGTDMYVITKNVYNQRIINKDTSNLPITFKSVNTLNGAGRLSLNHIYIATFTNNEEPKKLLKDCANARTVIEYEFDPFFSSFSKVKQKTLYWKNATVIHVLE
jgi:hypothetical protein